MRSPVVVIRTRGAAASTSSGEAPGGDAERGGDAGLHLARLGLAERGGAGADANGRLNGHGRTATSGARPPLE